MQRCMRPWPTPRQPPSPAVSPPPHVRKSVAGGPVGGGRTPNGQSSHIARRVLHRGDRGGLFGDSVVGVLSERGLVRPHVLPPPGCAGSPVQGRAASPRQETKGRSGAVSPPRHGGGRSSLVGPALKPKTTALGAPSSALKLVLSAPDEVDAKERAWRDMATADTGTQTEFWLPLFKSADGSKTPPYAAQSPEILALGARGGVATPLRGPQAFLQGAVQACAGLVVAPVSDHGELRDPLDPKTWPIIRDPAVWAICRHATSFACDALAAGQPESPSRLASPLATGRSLTPSRVGSRSIDEQPTPMFRARLEAAEKLLAQVTAERDELRQVCDMVLSVAEQSLCSIGSSSPRTPRSMEEDGLRFGKTSTEIAAAAKQALREMHAALALREKGDQVPIVHEGCASSACSTGGGSSVFLDTALETTPPTATSLVVPSDGGEASLSGTITSLGTTGELPYSPVGAPDTPKGSMVLRIDPRTSIPSACGRGPQSQSRQPAPSPSPRASPRVPPPWSPLPLQLPGTPTAPLGALRLQLQTALCSSSSTPNLRRPPCLVLHNSGQRRAGYTDVPAVPPGTPTIAPRSQRSDCDTFHPAVVLASGASASTDAPSTVHSFRPSSPGPPRCDLPRRVVPPCSPVPAAASRSLSPSPFRHGGRSVSVTRRHFRTQQVWVLEREEHFVVNSLG